MQVDYWSMLGYTNNATMMMEVFGSPSNIILTDNPSYTLDDFKSTFPVFVFSYTDEETGEETEGIPEAVFNLFLDMANKSIKYDRYKSVWKYCMGLYIAHYLTLFLQTQNGEPGAQQALQSAMPRGVAASKSVDGLSISYDFFEVASDFEGYGTYKLTIYGMQLITLTKPYGMGGLWVNG